MTLAMILLTAIEETVEDTAEAVGDHSALITAIAALVAASAPILITIGRRRDRDRSEQLERVEHVVGTTNGHGTLTEMVEHVLIHFGRLERKVDAIGDRVDRLDQSGGHAVDRIRRRVDELHPEHPDDEPTNDPSDDDWGGSWG
jgi:hypothetical protein